MLRIAGARPQRSPSMRKTNIAKILRSRTGVQNAASNPEKRRLAAI